jgi:hypothetical protein
MRPAAQHAHFLAIVLTSIDKNGKNLFVHSSNILGIAQPIAATKKGGAVVNLRFTLQPSIGL